MRGRDRREHEYLMGYLQLLEHDNAIIHNLLTEIRDELRKVERPSPYADLIAEQRENVRQLREQLREINRRLAATEHRTAESTRQVARDINKAATASYRRKLADQASGPRDLTAVIAEAVSVPSSEPSSSEFGQLRDAVHRLLVGLRRSVDEVLEELGSFAPGVSGVADDLVEEPETFLELIDSMSQGNDLLRRQLSELGERASQIEQRCLVAARRVAGHGDSSTSVIGTSEDGSPGPASRSGAPSRARWQV